MIIYLNKQPRVRYRKWQKIAHMLLPRLYGVNIVWDSSGKEPEIMPVYIPFMRYEAGDGQLLIEVGAWSENAIVILLFNRPPFVYITRGGGIELDIRREDDADKV